MNDRPCIDVSFERTEESKLLHDCRRMAEVRRGVAHRERREGARRRLGGRTRTGLALETHLCGMVGSGSALSQRSSWQRPADVPYTDRLARGRRVHIDSGSAGEFAGVRTSVGNARCASQGHLGRRISPTTFLLHIGRRRRCRRASHPANSPSSSTGRAGETATVRSLLRAVSHRKVVPPASKRRSRPVAKS